jgi:hypothetical protein
LSIAYLNVKEMLGRGLKDNSPPSFKSSIQHDGGEGLAKRKGVKVAARWTRTG